MLLDLEMVTLEGLIGLEVLEFIGREIHDGLDTQEPELLIFLVEDVHHVAQEERSCLDLAGVTRLCLHLVSLRGSLVHTEIGVLFHKLRLEVFVEVGLCDSYLETF